MMEHQTLTDAVAIFPCFDQFGKPYTVIVKQHEVQLVSTKPVTVIDWQLRKNGSSLRGAKDAAKFVMGTSSLHPFLTQTYPDIHVWFPSESTRNERCAYVALHKMIDYDHYLDCDDATIVYLQGKYSVVLPVAKHKFENRCNEAYRFLGKAYQYRQAPFEYIKLEEKQIIHCAEMKTDYLLN